MALQPKWDARRSARPPAARRTDTFSKSDNNTLRQILAEGKNGEERQLMGYSIVVEVKTLSTTYRGILKL